MNSRVMLHNSHHFAPGASWIKSTRWRRNIKWWLIFKRIIISYLHMARHRTWWWSASLPNFPCFFSAVMMVVVLVPAETLSYFPAQLLCWSFPLCIHHHQATGWCFQQTTKSFKDTHSCFCALTVWICLKTDFVEFFYLIMQVFSVCQAFTHAVTQINSTANLLLMSLYSIISWTVKSLLYPSVFPHWQNGHRVKNLTPL